MAKKNKKQDRRVVAVNKKARHKYHINETLEAGIALVGTEVKSVHEGNASIGEAYCVIRNHEVWMMGSHIAQYEHGGYLNHDPERKRKLLLHKSEIRKLEKETAAPGVALVPLEIYFNQRGYAKVRIALAVGKKQYDKREDIKKRDMQRDLERGD